MDDEGKVFGERDFSVGRDAFHIVNKLFILNRLNFTDYMWIYI